jgi:hypothetical protein
VNGGESAPGPSNGRAGCMDIRISFFTDDTTMSYLFAFMIGEKCHTSSVSLIC